MKSFLKSKLSSLLPPLNNGMFIRILGRQLYNEHNILQKDWTSFFDSGCFRVWNAFILPCFGKMFTMFFTCTSSALTTDQPNSTSSEITNFHVFNFRFFFSANIKNSSIFSFRNLQTSVDHPYFSVYLHQIWCHHQSEDWICCWLKLSLGPRPSSYISQQESQ